MGDISATDVDKLIATFFAEALADFAILQMEESVQAFAIDLILEDDLRTLDSLQLSAAHSAATEDTDVVFVCADAELVSVARRRGFDTVIPE